MSKFNVTISGDSFEELQKNVATMFYSPNEMPEAVAAPTVTKKKTTKKKSKTKKVEDDQPELPLDAAITKEAVNEALQQVNSVMGINEARNILKHFQASRVSDLKETDYERFVSHCAQAIG